MTDPILILTFPKDKATVMEDFITINTGMTVTEFIEALLTFASGPKQGMAVVSKEVEP